jgi:thioredoxin reductase
MENYIDNIIIGAGPAGLQLGYFFKKYNIEYVILEKNNSCGSFFNNYPHSKKLISINKVNTGSNNKEFNLRHDWNSLLNDEGHLFKEYSNKFYPDSRLLYKYLNDFNIKNKLNIIFNTNIISILKYNKYNYKIIDESNNIYYCNKLIIATGLSLPQLPNIIVNCDKKIYHYGEFPNGYFLDEKNLNKYTNKKLLIVGGGNSAYEIANLLNDYCSNILIHGSEKEYSLTSHYAGDLRSIYYPFLDSFYLKSLNAIDNVEKDNLFIVQSNKKDDINKNKYVLYHKDEEITKYYDSNDKHNYWDEIIICTGWKFNFDLFKFPIEKNNKYPNIKSNYESTNNKNLYFIGALMHSLDYKKSSGGFIHGFRYLIKLFCEINYNIAFKINKFLFNKDGLLKLTKHVMYKINITSGLYQMFGTMCDLFFIDNNNNIIYINDLTKDYVLDNFKYLNKIYLIQLNYGNKVYDLRELGGFDQLDPKFLHLQILIYENINNNFIQKDKVRFEEDLFADFTSKEDFNNIYKILKHKLNIFV